MTRDELIETTAMRNSLHPISWINGINSDLNRDLQELTVIEGRLFDLNWLSNISTSKHDIDMIKLRIEKLETARTELLTKLNITE